MTEPVMTEPVLFEELACQNGKVVALATLNVEKTLNSLSLEMIDLLSPQLVEWQDDTRIVLIVFRGAGDRAFCAGGDIQALYGAMVEHRGSPSPYAEAFFEREYRLDYLIHSCKKPMMVWGHGIVMGGGLGIFTGCSHRIGTEKSRIALPEITIGLFPDAGASVFLNKMPAHLAYFMALTGCQINGQDALMVGLADNLIPWSKEAAVRSALTELNWGENPADNGALLSEMLSTFDDPAEFPQGKLAAHSQLIEQMISKCSESDFLSDFEKALDQIGSDDDWFHRAASTFRSGCPTTAHIIIEQLSRIRNFSVREMFALELTIAVQCSRHPEFAEGVRALLIDKDNEPQWRYPKRNEVPRNWVIEHFEEMWPGGNPLQDLT